MKHEFTRTEREMFQMLQKMSPDILTRDDLIYCCNNTDVATSNNVDVHIMNLRRKLSLAGRPEKILTQRGLGYSLVTS